ncbi:MAG: benzoate 1,2-dioxygenase small subunit [Candidatus Elarobacter sp.]
MLRTGRADSITRSDVEEFLFREARLLDRWELDAWTELFTADARYVVPSNDKPDGDPLRDLVIVDDNHARILARVTRLKSRHAHREYPTSRTRHQVTNVLVLDRIGDTVRVEAAFTVWRFRNDRADYYVGRYDYTLVVTDDGLRIRAKRATMDMTSLNPAGAVSIIL